MATRVRHQRRELSRQLPAGESDDLRDEAIELGEAREC